MIVEKSGREEDGVEGTAREWVSIRDVIIRNYLIIFGSTWVMTAYFSVPFLHNNEWMSLA